MTMRIFVLWHCPRPAFLASRNERMSDEGTEAEEHTDEPSIPLRTRQADARWSKQVLGHGYTLIPALLISGQSRLGLSPEQFNIIVHLAYHWRSSTSNPYPTKRRLAAMLGKSEKQVQRYLKELEEKNYIVRIMRYRDGRGQTSSAYDLRPLVIALKELANDAAAVKHDSLSD